MKGLPRWIGWIPARGGSKGVPRKALAPVGEQPLIAWTIREALAAPQLERVIVSTDCPEIADVAREHGAEVPQLRPARLSGDHADLTQALEYSLGGLAAEGYLVETVCVLSPTNPFRRPERLEDALSLLQRDRALHCVRSMAPMQTHPADTVVLDEAGRIRPLEHRGQAIRRTAQVGIESLSFNIFRTCDSPARGQRAVLLDAVEGTDVDEPRDLLRAQAIAELGSESSWVHHLTQDLLAEDDRFPLLSEETIQAARRLHRESGRAVVSVRAVRHHPWRAFDLEDPSTPRHLLGGELARGRRQDLPEVYEVVDAASEMTAQQRGRLPELLASGECLGVVLPECESLRIDGPIEQAMLGLLLASAKPGGGAGDPLR